MIASSPGKQKTMSKEFTYGKVLSATLDQEALLS